MNLKLKHFSLARRLEILIQTNTDLKAQLLELLELREQLRTATRDRSLVQTKTRRVRAGGLSLGPLPRGVGSATS